MRVDQRPHDGPLVPAPPPSRTAAGYSTGGPTYVYPGGGTGKDAGMLLTDTASVWNSRFREWREGFEQGIGSAVRKYWSLYRIFDSGLAGGPNQSWRDRTVIPECFKIIETRIPKIVLGLFGQAENFAVEGRDRFDEEYEEVVRILLQSSIDEIGSHDPKGEVFMKRMIDGIRYSQIMGHVWWKVFWRAEDRYIKTKVRENGGWTPIELQERVYDNCEVIWLPLDSIAVDMSGSNRWKIERVQTSAEALRRENANYRRETGEDLYKNLALIPEQGIVHRDTYEEPRDTEHWPLTTERISYDPKHQPVELWLCWDNEEGTLTKLVNRSIVLDEGYAPTADGLDPYIGLPAVPVPGRIYGDSILHWIGPLAQYQTRIARARADEVLLNLWQQYIYREGSLLSTQMFWRPGGGMPISQPNPDRPITDSVHIFPRRPVFNEAFREEGYRQQQAESTGNADPVSQGVEATQKSRDVSATEIQQRVTQGGSRYQLEVLYHEVAFKKPMLQAMYDLLRQNLTQPKMLRILGEDRQVDLSQLDRPVDIVVGGGYREVTRQAREGEIERWLALTTNPVLGPYLRGHELLTELVRNSTSRWKDPSRFVKTEEEVKSEQQQAAAAAAAQQAAQQGVPSNGGGSPIAGLPQGVAPTAAQGGAAALSGPSGEQPESPPSASGSSVEEI